MITRMLKNIISCNFKYWWKKYIGKMEEEISMKKLMSGVVLAAGLLFSGFTIPHGRSSNKCRYVREYAACKRANRSSDDDLE